MQEPPEMFYKKVVFKNFAIFTEKHLCWSLFLIKFIKKVKFIKEKETPAQVFFCQYGNIFKNNHFLRK